MEIRNCRTCGRIYNYLSGPNLCPSCTNDLEKKFDEVKEYVYDNPGVGIQEVSEKMDVSVSQIKQWIREERLAFTEDSLAGLECERCGKLIKTGRFCKFCKDDLTKQLGSIYKKPEPPVDKSKDHKDNAKMRFLNQ